MLVGKDDSLAYSSTQRHSTDLNVRYFFSSRGKGFFFNFGGANVAAASKMNFLTLVLKIGI